jgi:hypothetical protein
MIDTSGTRTLLIYLDGAMGDMWHLVPIGLGRVTSTYKVSVALPVSIDNRCKITIPNSDLIEFICGCLSIDVKITIPNSDFDRIDMWGLVNRCKITIPNSDFDRIYMCLCIITYHYVPLQLLEHSSVL